MEVEESPVVEIVTDIPLLDYLETQCPFLDFTDLSLTVGDVSHELNAQAASGNVKVPAQSYRMAGVFVAK